MLLVRFQLYKCHQSCIFDTIMKRLYVVRHAKSSWKDLSKGDHDRPLNSRGKTDGPLMAGLFARKYDEPEYWMSSSALRAKDTANYFLKAYGRGADDILVDRSLYHASVRSLVSSIHRIDETASTAIMFGHNPGFSDLVDELCYFAAGHMPTCAIAVIESDAEFWANFESGNCSLIEFLYPKNNLPQIYG